MEKTSKAETPPGEFKVTTPENLPLSQQAITSKEIAVPYTNLQLNPYPNIQLACEKLLHSISPAVTALKIILIYF